METLILQLNSCLYPGILCIPKLTVVNKETLIGRHWNPLSKCTDESLCCAGSGAGGNSKFRVRALRSPEELLQTPPWQGLLSVVLNIAVSPRGITWWCSLVKLQVWYKRCLRSLCGSAIRGVELSVLCQSICGVRLCMNLWQSQNCLLQDLCVLVECQNPCLWQPLVSLNTVTGGGQNTCRTLPASGAAAGNHRLPAGSSRLLNALSKNGNFSSPGAAGGGLTQLAGGQLWPALWTTHSSPPPYPTHPRLGSPCSPCVTLPWSAARIGDILCLQGQWLESEHVIAHRARLCLVILFLELSKRRINSYSLVWFRAEHPLDALLQSWPAERANLLFQVCELLQQARAGIVVQESAAALWHVDKGLWVLSALQRFPSTMRSDCRLILAQQCALSILLSWVKLIMRLT